LSADHDTLRHRGAKVQPSVSTASRCVVALAKKVFRNRLQLKVGRALIDLSDLRVAIELLDRVVLDESVAAEEIHRQRGDAFGDLGREQLADGGFGDEGLARLAQTG